MLLVIKNALIPSEDQQTLGFLDIIMDEQNKTPWIVWSFVIGLNVVGLLGAMYLQSKGINVFAIRGGS